MENELRRHHPQRMSLTGRISRGNLTRWIRDFYKGELAVAVADGLRSAGSPLTAEDLKRTRARIEDPLRIGYREGTLVSTCPPTQGLTTLQIMGLLDRLNIRQVPEGSADYWSRILRSQGTQSGRSISLAGLRCDCIRASLKNLMI